MRRCVAIFAVVVDAVAVSVIISVAAVVVVVVLVISIVVVAAVVVAIVTVFVIAVAVVWLDVVMKKGSIINYDMLFNVFIIFSTNMFHCLQHCNFPLVSI